MELSSAIKLIECEYILGNNPATWADLGSGTGLFSYALANILPNGSSIYAIDQSSVTLKEYPNPKNNAINQLQLDFINQELPFSSLDGILMANSLHFVRDKISCIKKLSRHLKPGAAFLIVEYNTDTSNRWVPYPVSFSSLKELFASLGYVTIDKLREVPSLFGSRTMYSAIICESKK